MRRAWDALRAAWAACVALPRDAARYRAMRAVLQLDAIGGLWVPDARARPPVHDRATQARLDGIVDRTMRAHATARRGRR